MLYNYPILIEGTAVPYPDEWSVTPEKIANTFETESGGITKNIVRTERKVCDVSFTVTSFWLKKFLAYRAADSLIVHFYDAASDGYDSYEMLIDDESFSYTLITASRYAQNTNGLYKVRFTLQEI